MAVRRLAEAQPDTFAFTQENRAWAERIIAKFPAGRQASAVIQLLWRAQDQEGWLTRPAIESVAKMLDMPLIRVLEVATFYTMFHLEPVGSKAHIQVCGTTPCMLRGAGELIDICRARIHPHPHHRSADGALSWEEVECLGACVNAPMVQVSKDTYEDLTGEVFEALLDAFARDERPPPGPQNGRQYSMPITGLTSLKEIDYAADDVPPEGRYGADAGRSAGAAPSAPTPPAAEKSYPPGELLRAKQARRAGGAPKASGADPRGPATEAQKIGRVDPTGRADEAAARAVGEPAGQPKGHSAKVQPPERRSGEDRAAQPRSDRDSETGDREG
ncbi:MAG TPA: NADH-quinone oxidoreductase subunit NuoE [Propylenella sp.]